MDWGREEKYTNTGNHAGKHYWWSGIMAAAAKKIEVIVEEPEVIVEEPEVIVEEPETSADTPDELDIPEGGIGGFAMSEEDFAVLEAEEAKKEFGEDGLAQFTAVAKKMAGHGRFGDDSVAHIQTGEMVVPLTLLESNPALKAQIFKQLRASGIEDPEQYVVGSKANSINPETGLMEFGFFSKLWKGIKKVVKAVVKVVKKVAPIILPIALAFTPLGAVYGAAMGSGIGTLINGGSIKDALKSALISGATAGVMKGVSGAIKGEGFLKSVGAELSNPLGRAGATLEGAKSTFTGGGFSGEGNLFSTYAPTSTAPTLTEELTEAVTDAGTTSTHSIVQGDTLGGIAQANNTTVDALMAANPNITDPNMIYAGDSINIPSAGGTASGGATFTESINVDAASGDPGFLERTGDVMFRGGNTKTDVLLAQQQGGVDAVAAAQAAGVTDSNLLKAVKAAGIKAGGPGMLARFGPSALAGTALAAGAGFFKVPEPEMPNLMGLNEDGTVITGEDLIAADPSKYLVHDLGTKRLNLETGEYENVEDTETSGNTFPTDYPMPPITIPQNPGSPFARPYVTAADGGPIYPRRNGGVSPGEGVQGQDSVRAMLMPGEFVMTTDAVRGLGNGNLNNGIKSMYSVMRNLESRGRAFA